ncbi:hypothetical protein ACIBEJ_44740 [Nonomuraea sp. NPDC050790]|uniref:hypothetical protein n=1 Tax=Nonomuraea sp. NPDC050790 TaxID=3364371 RepID=UPI003798825F
MLAISLGLAWLVLAPLSLWVLVRGHNLARAGAVAVLVLLESGTVALADALDPEPVVVSHTMPRQAECAESAPVPATARVVRRRSLELTWPASATECDTAKVLLRPKGHKLRVWIHEGPLTGVHPGVTTVPVHVNGGAASLRVPLPRPGAYRAIDGRTNHRIPTP